MLQVDSNTKSCDFWTYKSCVSAVNIPPYFLSLDYHINKFFELDEWNRRISDINWCDWSLHIPSWIGTQDSKLDLQENKEVKTPLVKSQGSKTLNKRSNTSVDTQTVDICSKYNEKGDKNSSLRSTMKTDTSNLKNLPLFNKKAYVDEPQVKDLREKIKEVYIFEKKWLRNTIIKHMPTLQQLYYRYASVSCAQKPDFEPGLIRIFLWKLLRDIDVYKTGFSLVEIDELAG